MACFNLLILQSNLDDVICRLGKGVLRAGICSIALGLSIYSYTKVNSTDKPVVIQQAKPNLKELTIPEQDRENLVALHGYILDLETRIHELENQTHTLDQERLTSLVKQAMAQQESERRAEIEKRNPAMGWLEIYLMTTANASKQTHNMPTTQ